jgi:hypothetical protein
MSTLFTGGKRMGDKKSPFGYLLAGLLGAIAGAASILGLSKMMPKMMEKCCGGMKGSKCCGGGHEAGKTSGKKRKKK